MAKTNGKKITVGSVLGVVLLIAVFIARQQGWLPAGNEVATDADTRTAQNDADTHTPSVQPQEESQSTPRVDPTPRETPRNTGRTGGAAIPGGDGGIGEHFRNQRNDVIVTAAGLVSRILPDDNDGSRHQKFIVTLSTGHTVQIAHNIDLAERVPCDVGDLVRFRGEYEHTERGGVVHWTHHDPAGRHQPGWIEFEGVRYQ